MLAIFPGRQIHLSTAPELANAAKVSMEARGNGKTGWSKVFKACVYARLFEAEHSYELIADVLQTKCHGNLWTTHPPFQIDANFGYAAAVNEMLAQSHTGEIHLLPALPKAWPKGQVKGMRLRGGFELDMQWADGKLLEAKVRNVSNTDGKFRVLYEGATKDFQIDREKSLTLTAAMLSK